MLQRLVLLQLCQFAPPQARLVMTYSALTATLFYQAGVSSSRPDLQFSSRQELMDVLHLALDWP